MAGSQPLAKSGIKNMNKKLLTTILVTLFISSIVVPQLVAAQSNTDTSDVTDEPTPTDEAAQTSGPDLLLIVVIVVVVVAVAGGVAAFLLVKRKSVNEKSLRKLSASDFQDWVVKRFNGKPGDASLGVDGFTEGGQPLLIKNSENVNAAEVEGFVDVLVRGKAQKGTIVAFNFENDASEGKIKAMDNGIELQLMRTYELVNKRYADRIKDMAAAQVSFEASALPVYAVEKPMAETMAFEQTPIALQQNGPKKPIVVFVSNGSPNIVEQIKKMLDFLRYNYVVGDKEETAVPISENKFGLMKSCDCAIVDICAAEQERRYSGIYVLNSKVVSEISAAYLKYNTQVVLLVERKVDLPANLKGLKRLEYDNDNLQFTAAIDLEKALADFKKV